MTASPALRLAGAAQAAREAVLDGLAVLAPVACAGCGTVDRAVCAVCLGVLAPVPRTVTRPVPSPEAPIVVHASLEYAGVVATTLAAFKDGGRTDAVRPLALALRAAVVAALTDAGPGAPVELCTVPSTRRALRERGYAPVELLLARSGIRSARVLRLARDRVDQAGLDHAARRANAAGGLVAARRLDGRRFLLVDDILTTGSTLAESARAVRSAGGSVAGCAVLAETPLRRIRLSANSLEAARDNGVQADYGGRTGVVDPPFRTG
ncbi:ComF family protein [Agromyces lapidis]|uniref:ComF family protein n=1 Tax=Agromyces lapidis TaxID=279574 RepID=A0ABV5SUT1_9MICO|nr:phosphoribosyltransferase family protein [Agromyces lapidis]